MYNRLFLDSGAFSADKSGEPIKLDDYIQFIHNHRNKFTVYANLDVIGDWKQTWANQRSMEAEGLTPLPVHHLEDPMECLDWCLEYKYFALGGIAGGATTKDRIRFFDKCWNIICDKDGFPQSKVHGFGMASPKLVFKYPWYSIDSSSWVAYGRYGLIIIPKIKQNAYSFSESPAKLFVSDKSTRKGDDGIHFDTLKENERKAVLTYLDSLNIPFGDEDTKGVSNDNFWRDLCNYFFFTEMCAATPKYPWCWKRSKIRTLF